MLSFLVPLRWPRFETPTMIPMFAIRGNSPLVVTSRLRLTRWVSVEATAQRFSTLSLRKSEGVLAWFCGRRELARTLAVAKGVGEAIFDRIAVTY